MQTDISKSLAEGKVRLEHSECSYVSFLLANSSLTPLEKAIKAVHKESLRHINTEKRQMYKRVIQIMSELLDYEDIFEIAVYKQGFQDGIKIKQNEQEVLSGKN
jgi:hypothetical protein